MEMFKGTLLERRGRDMCFAYNSSTVQKGEWNLNSAKSGRFIHEAGIHRGACEQKLRHILADHNQASYCYNCSNREKWWWHIEQG